MEPQNSNQNASDPYREIPSLANEPTPATSAPTDTAGKSAQPASAASAEPAAAPSVAPTAPEAPSEPKSFILEPTAPATPASEPPAPTPASTTPVSQPATAAVPSAPAESSEQVRPVEAPSEGAAFRPTAVPAQPAAPAPSPVSAVTAAMSTATPAPKTPEKPADAAAPAPVQSRIIRTFESDAAGVIRNEKATLAHIAVAEADKKHEGRIEIAEKPHSGRNIFNIAMIIVLIIMTTGLLGYVMFVKDRLPGTANALIPNEILFVESRAELPTDGQTSPTFQESVSKAIATENVTPNTLRNLYPTAGAGELAHVLVPGEFMDLFAPEAPAGFVRTFTSYLLGLYGTTHGNVPVLVIHVSDYDHAYAGMLEWEETIASDLAFLVPGSITEEDSLELEETASSTAAVATSTATTTATSTEVATSSATSTEEVLAPESELEKLKGIAFKDTVIDNKDVRYLAGPEGVALLYSFIDRSTLVITTDTAAFEALVTRLQRSQAAQ